MYNRRVFKVWLLEEVGAELYLWEDAQGQKGRIRSMELERAEGLVLRRRPYSETSLILALLTRERGVVHLMVKGAAKRSASGRDVIDLFRVVQATWRPSRSGDLHTARSVEVVASYEEVARDPDAFAVYGWIFRYLLSSQESHGEHPELYAAITGMLQRLRRGTAPEPMALWTALMLTLAREEGILPHYSPDYDRRFAQIIQAAADADGPFPPYPSATWLSLRDWCSAVFSQSGHVLPDGWQKF